MGFNSGFKGLIEKPVGRLRIPDELCSLVLENCYYELLGQVSFVCLFVFFNNEHTLVVINSFFPYLCY